MNKVIDRNIYFLPVRCIDVFGSLEYTDVYKYQ